MSLKTAGGLFLLCAAVVVQAVRWVEAMPRPVAPPAGPDPVSPPRPRVRPVELVPEYLN